MFCILESSLLIISNCDTIEEDVIYFAIFLGHRKFSPSQHISSININYVTYIINMYKTKPI